jgi:hypothetical protein
MSLDTVDDPDDAQAAQQRPAAVAALSECSLVTVTVILEFFFTFDRRLAKRAKALGSSPAVDLLS